MKFSFALLLIFSLLFSANRCFAQEHQSISDSLSASQVTASEYTIPVIDDLPAAWSVFPFVLLLLMTATGPLFYAHFWHKNYKAISLFLGIVVISYYFISLNNFHNPVHALAEYFSFISLLTALFVASGGIVIKQNSKATPLTNALLLIGGAAIANVIGTTGASMLLIRPFIRLNKNRIQPYHIVFFIFIVSNVGGCLTPIGDPPLFIGFLKGVPFFWTVEHLWIKWLFGVGLLTLLFFIIDKMKHPKEKETFTASGEVDIKGVLNIFWLGVIIGAVFLDPNLVDWLPAIPYHGDKISFIREVVMLGAAYMAYHTSDKEYLRLNDFNFEPIKEVAFLFAGIFTTMMPALQLISNYAHHHAGEVSRNSIYWASGIVSSVLDNAPTYLNFLAAGMGKTGLNLGIKEHVEHYALGKTSLGVETIETLVAVSVASVFFGACTYIGNAPNFMVKSIAEQSGIKMPSFFGYIFRYTIPYLLPVLFLTWLIFVYFELAI